MRQALLFFCGVALMGQTLRLRYGGPQSLYHITSISTGTPAVVTVKSHVSWQQEHDFVNGDVVYIQFVLGCAEANGFRKVTSANRSAGTFAITDLDDNPITCSYPYIYSGFESGMVGKVGLYTLRSTRPRVFLPGSGPLLERSKDPDGSGPQVAPVVTENDYPWQAMLTKYAPYITPGCDGQTPSLCPNEELALDIGDGSGTWGYAAHTAAYIWFADNSKTGYLNLAKYLINHVERALLTNTAGARPGWGWPCDVTTDSCGWGSGCDWMSIGMWHYSLAYDLIRDQLTSGQREAFAKKMLNGWGGEHDCSNQLQKQTGTSNLTQGSHTVTGSGFSAYSAGDGVYFKTAGRGSAGKWGYVVSVTSDSEMTVNFIIGSSKTAASDITYSGADHYKVLPWTSTLCGAAFLASGQGQTYNVGGAVIGRAVTWLASGIDAEQTTIAVTHAGGFPSPPFYVLIGNPEEVVRVTATDGTTWTVQRGQHYTSPALHNAGAWIEWSSQPNGKLWGINGPRALAGEWYHNLTAQKAVGFLVAAFVLAGDDTRAADYAERVWNWYYDTIYVTNKEYWSGPTQGGLQNQGYQFGRWQANQLWVGLAGRNSFESGSIDILETYFWRGLTTALLWTPPDGTNHWRRLPHEVSTGDPYSTRNSAWLAAATTLWPSTEAQYAQYWLRNLSGLFPNLDGAHGVLYAAYSPANATQREFRGELPPWSFHIDTDYDGYLGGYYGLLVSKKDWSTSSSLLVANPGWHWPTDHNVDQGMYIPGSYTILKGLKLLFGADNTYGIGGGSTSAPWFRLIGKSLKSVTHPPWYSASGGSQMNRADRRHADQTYVYARGNFTDSWQSGVTSHYRHFLHVKTEPEYVIVYDEAETSTAGSVESYLQYCLRADAGQTFSASSDYRSIVFKKPTGSAAMISTRVLFPDGANPAVSYAQTSNVHKVTFTWDSVTSAKMLTVHRVALGTSDEMPAVQMLSGLDGDSVGVEILDAQDPVAVVFAKDGADRNQCSFRVAFTRTGRIIVTGLAPGNYRVYRDGQEVTAAPIVVGAGDGTLYLEGGAGAYTITGTPPASLGVDPVGLKFQYEVGTDDPAPQVFRATCTGGSCSVSVQETCEWLWVSPQAGFTPQDFTVNVQPQGLEKGSYSCTITVSAPALNSPQEVVVLLEVTEGQEPPPSEPALSVECVGATSRRLVVRYGYAGLERNQTCRVELSDSPKFERILESVEDAGGLARRVSALGSTAPLAPATTYYVRANCADQSRVATMATKAGGAGGARRVTFKMRPIERISAARVRVEYGYGPEMGIVAVGSCTAGGCEATVEVESDRLLYFRYVYMDAQGAELARSGVQVLAVP